MIFTALKNCPLRQANWELDNVLGPVQLPVGLLAQLVERCTGIAEVMGSNPIRA